MWRWVAVLCLVACMHRDTPVLPPLAVWLDDADKAWIVEDADALQRSSDALDRAWSVDPHAPAVLWRIARRDLFNATRMTDDRAALRTIGRARELALSGVPAPIPYAAVVPGEVVPWLATLHAEQRECVRWASRAWTAWLLRFGESGASMDAERVRFLRDVEAVIDAKYGAEPETLHPKR